jgi:hypothetical protein
MKLKDYIKSLQDIIADSPEAAEYLVISGKDDEGNGFNLAHYAPSVCQYVIDDDDFTHKEAFFEDPEEYYFDESIGWNAVCVH